MNPTPASALTADPLNGLLPAGWPVGLGLAAAPDGLGFAPGAIDRDTLGRLEAEALVQLPEARHLVCVGDDIVLKAAPEGPGDPLFALLDIPAKAAQRERVYLGKGASGPLFATLINAEAKDELAGDERFRLAGLRALAMEARISPPVLAQLATAKAITNWHVRHRFCSNCGAPTAASEGGWRRDCGFCDVQHFPRTDPVVIMLVAREDHCLLGRQPRFMPNMVSCLAGFMEPGETVEEAVRREVMEEAGLSIGRVAIIANQPWPFPMSLMIGCFAEALSEAITIDPQELEWARWFSRAEVRAMLDKRHAEQLNVPPAMAIAHHLIRAWAEG